MKYSDRPFHNRQDKSLRPWTLYRSTRCPWETKALSVFWNDSGQVPHRYVHHLKGSNYFLLAAIFSLSFCPLNLHICLNNWCIYTPSSPNTRGRSLIPESGITPGRKNNLTNSCLPLLLAALLKRIEPWSVCVLRHVKQMIYTKLHDQNVDVCASAHLTNYAGTDNEAYSMTKQNN